MKLLPALLWLLAAAPLAQAHRLDEYLQATTLALEPNRVTLQLRLTPGIAILPVIHAAIDTNADGSLSPHEKINYLRRALADIQLNIAGQHTPLHLESFQLPTDSSLTEGTGTFIINASTPALPSSPRRTLTIANRHQPPISLYLVNVLQPENPAIQVLSQRRNPDQSHYEVSYSEPTAATTPTILVAGITLLALTRLWFLRAKSKNPGNAATPSRHLRGLQAPAGTMPRVARFAVPLPPSSHSPPAP